MTGSTAGFSIVTLRVTSGKEVMANVNRLEGR